MKGTFSTTICITGTTRRALVAGACFAEMGHHVRFFDSDNRRLAVLERDPASTGEPGLDRLLHRNCHAGRIAYSPSPSEAFFATDFILIDGDDLRARARSIARAHKGGLPIVVALPPAQPGAGDVITSALRSANAARGLPPVVSNPLFLRTGTAITDFLHPGRVVIGSRNIQAAECVAELYIPLRCPIVITDLRTAEALERPSDALAAALIRVG